MGKCKDCKSWRRWNNNSDFGSCEILNNENYVYSEVEDCVNVREVTSDFMNNSNAEFGCIKFKNKTKK